MVGLLEWSHGPPISVDYSVILGVLRGDVDVEAVEVGKTVRDALSDPLVVCPIHPSLSVSNQEPGHDSRGDVLYLLLGIFSGSFAIDIHLLNALLSGNNSKNFIFFVFDNVFFSVSS